MYESYEKHGLMSKLKSPVVIEYLRSRAESNTFIVEDALRKKLGLERKEWKRRNRKKRERRHAGANESTHEMAVKVNSIDLIDHIIKQRMVHGISHRHTIESAVLSVIAEENGGAA